MLGQWLPTQWAPGLLPITTGLGGKKEGINSESLGMEMD